MNNKENVLNAPVRSLIHPDLGALPMPVVSVGLPVYNGERFIEETIESILGQTFEDFELIISDNASTDRTADICRAVVRRDDRVRLSRFDVNRGASANYNHVFLESRGKYFKWAAHDDLLKPTFLRTCLDAFECMEPGIAVVYPRAEFIDESGMVTHRDADTQQAASRYAGVRAYEMLQRMSMAHAVFGLFDAQMLRRTRLIGSFVSSDYVLLLQMSLLGRIVQLDTEPLFQRRVHPGMSRVANRTKEDVLHWFDPTARTRLSEHNRLRVEYLRSPYVVAGLGPLSQNVYAACIVAGFSVSFVRAKLGVSLR